MANSFGDQLLKAGLVKKDQLNKAKKSKHKQRKQESRKQAGAVSETAAAVQQAAAEKAARDSELNRQKQQAAEHRAVQAQIRQLIEMNRLPTDEGELGYHFQDGTAIRKLFVSEEVHSKLTRGLLAIVKIDSSYAVIPTVVAEKIRLRDADCIIGNAASQLETGEDDPYGDYKVPDDLMW